jgi:hypothetical protein
MSAAQTLQSPNPFAVSSSDNRAINATRDIVDLPGVELRACRSIPACAPPMA